MVKSVWFVVSLFSVVWVFIEFIEFFDGGLIDGMFVLFFILESYYRIFCDGKFCGLWVVIFGVYWLGVWVIGEYVGVGEIDCIVYVIGYDEYLGIEFGLCFWFLIDCCMMFG